MNDIENIILEELREVKKDVKFLMHKESMRTGMAIVLSGIVSFIVAIGAKFL